MTGKPIMTFMDEGAPAGRVLVLSFDGGPGCHYLIPDDGRDYLDIPLSEMRPYPALDAKVALDRIFGKSAPRSEPPVVPSSDSGNDSNDG